MTTIEQIISLETGWRALERTCKRPVSVFQSFDWVLSWCELYLRSNQPPEVLTMVGFQDNELVFVLPLVKTRTKGVTTLGWLTEPSAQYGDILIEKDQPAAVWMKATLHLLRQFKGVDALRLRHVRADSNIAEFARSSLRDAHLIEQAPFLDLTLFPTEAEYDTRYTSAQRKRRKKIRKNLEELGPLAFKVLASGSLCDSAMTAAIEEKNKWLQERGRMNLILHCPVHLQFLKRLSRGNGETTVCVTELSAGGKPLSWEIAFRYGGVHYAYITSHVNALTDLSPGRLHMDYSQRRAIADGMTRFDLMVPYDLHKESWCSGKVETRDYHFPLSMTGSIYGKLYLEWLRPVVRKAYYTLPQGALRLIQRLARP